MYQIFCPRQYLPEEPGELGEPGDRKFFLGATLAPVLIQ
jgi:hypothetical protein